MAPIITLLTDFGIKDGYVASMKGVILGICPEARLVDVSHLVPPQDVRAGAYLLSTVYRYFPQGAIHLAVVDPGVGTERRALALSAGGHSFVGPDNGLFSMVIEGTAEYRAHSLENPEFWRSTISSTFHGRDIFAPVAAHLARGTPLDAFGPPCTPMSVQWSSSFSSGHALHGEIVYIDHFGNIITNLIREEVESFAAERAWTVHLGPHHVTGFAGAYDRVEVGKAICLFGSDGHLEIAVNRGSAAELLRAHTGNPVILQLSDGSQ